MDYKETEIYNKIEKNFINLNEYNDIERNLINGKKMFVKGSFYYKYGKNNRKFTNECPICKKEDSIKIIDFTKNYKKGDEFLCICEDCKNYIIINKKNNHEYFMEYILNYNVKINKLDRLMYKIYSIFHNFFETTEDFMSFIFLIFILMMIILYNTKNTEFSVIFLIVNIILLLIPKLYLKILKSNEERFLLDLYINDNYSNIIKNKMVLLKNNIENENEKYIYTDKFINLTIKKNILLNDLNNYRIIKSHFEKKRNEMKNEIYKYNSLDKKHISETLTIQLDNFNKIIQHYVEKIDYIIENILKNQHEIDEEYYSKIYYENEVISQYILLGNDNINL